MTLWIAGTAGIAVASFLAGLLLLRVKTRWCPVCGTRLQCRYCTGQPGNGAKR
jgi:hypothetical protein